MYHQPRVVRIICDYGFLSSLNRSEIRDDVIIDITRERKAMVSSAPVKIERTRANRTVYNVCDRAANVDRARACETPISL